MTELTEQTGNLPEAVHQFVLLWGKLGERWGVNRSVSQIHALLYASERALTADEIADTLNIARSNVSTSLRELQTWDIVRPVSVMGDRRTFYEAETDLWTLVARIASGRKARELDPAAAALRQCLAAAEGDAAVSQVATKRLREMLEFVERTGRWYEQMLALPRSQLVTLMKLGSGVTRLLDLKLGRPRRKDS
jgi:DNA-binding transcriptional regulator GbsR (MarR family)